MCVISTFVFPNKNQYLYNIQQNWEEGDEEEEKERKKEGERNKNE